MNTFGIVGLIILIVVLIVIGPLLTIWAINTLFGLSIAYTFKTWLASVLLCAVFSGQRPGRKG